MPEQRRGERRAPMALAVLAAGGTYLLIPPTFRVWAPLAYLYPTFLVVLLAALIIGDPGRIDRDRAWLRVLTGVMVGWITVVAAAAAVRLVVGILDGAPFTSAGELLRTGAAVWSTQVIAFALWYWLLDAGGPARRAAGPGGPSAFRFPEHDLAEWSARGWYPQFVDYLALSFGTSTAFSVTDVSAVRHWSKLCMMAQAVMSLVLVALVVARAVNVL